MALKVIDRFTTRDGLWEVDPRPYGLTKEALKKYGGWDIPGKGGASHIFVKTTPFTEVNFYTDDPTTPQSEYRMTNANGWTEFAMWKSAAYWPPNLGPWNVRCNGIVIARGEGLPEGLHVSTFLIVEDTDTVPVTPDKPVSHIQVIVDDVMVFDNWSAL